MVLLFLLDRPNLRFFFPVAFRADAERDVVYAERFVDLVSVLIEPPVAPTALERTVEAFDGQRRPDDHENDQDPNGDQDEGEEGFHFFLQSDKTEATIANAIDNNSIENAEIIINIPMS